MELLHLKFVMIYLHAVMMMDTLCQCLHYHLYQMLFCKHQLYYQTSQIQILHHIQLYQQSISNHERQEAINYLRHPKYQKLHHQPLAILCLDLLCLYQHYHPQQYAFFQFQPFQMLFVVQIDLLIF